METAYRIPERTPATSSPPYLRSTRMPTQDRTTRASERTSVLLNAVTFMITALLAYTRQPNGAQHWLVRRKSKPHCDHCHSDPPKGSAPTRALSCMKENLVLRTIHSPCTLQTRCRDGVEQSSSFCQNQFATEKTFQQTEAMHRKR